jgi:hypothetical protein
MVDMAETGDVPIFYLVRASSALVLQPVDLQSMQLWCDVSRGVPYPVF